MLYVVLESAGITCPIKYLTGISCAGCGMSRAWLAVFRGDFAAAFSFHPLFWLPGVAAAVFIFRKQLPAAVYRAFWSVVVVLALGVYLVRMLDPENEVVVFHPEAGLFARMFRALLEAAGAITNS